MFTPRFETFVTAKSNDSESVLRFSLVSDEFGSVVEFLDLFGDLYSFDVVEIYRTFSTVPKEETPCHAENM